MPSHPIEFLAKPELLDVFPKPFPAARAVPEWYRQMPTQSGPDVPTVKRCPPFLEAMTAGYIIPLPVDVTITRTATQLTAHAPDFKFPLVQMHMQDQFPNSPFGNAPLLKFVSPWLIKTPPGYSTLFIPPMNRFDSPIVPLCGIVETDTFYHGVAFPSICLLEAGQQAVLKAGTPLVQVIPILREQWSATFAGWDEHLMKAQDDELVKNPHFYKDQHWQKKSYG